MGNVRAMHAWRAEVSKHRLAYALLAAFVATHIATVSGYWYKNGILLMGHTGSSTKPSDR